MARTDVAVTLLPCALHSERARFVRCFGRPTEYWSSSGLCPDRAAASNHAGETIWILSGNDDAVSYLAPLGSDVMRCVVLDTFRSLQYLSMLDSRWNRNVAWVVPVSNRINQHPNVVAFVSILHAYKDRHRNNHSLSLSLSLSHTHTHTQSPAECCYWYNSATFTLTFLPNLQ